MYIENDDDDDDGLVRMRQGGSTVAWPSLPPDPEHGYDGNQAREHRSRPHQPYRARSLPSFKSRPHQPYRTRSLPSPGHTNHTVHKIFTKFQPSSHHPTSRIATGSVQFTRSYFTPTGTTIVYPILHTTHQQEITQSVPSCPVTRQVQEE